MKNEFWISIMRALIVGLVALLFGAPAWFVFSLTGLAFVIGGVKWG